MVADGFTLYCCGLKTAPTALVACYEWDHYCDLLTICDFERVITARAPKQGRRVDIFAPEVVVWAYEGPPQHALRALLRLVHPAHPDAPTTDYPAPPSLCVPRAQQRPMTIQLPSPDRARARAARLTAMTTHGGDLAISAAGPAVTQNPGWSLVENERTPDACGSRRPADHQHHPSKGEVRHVR
ncbi:MAG: hypothetical protein ACRDTH_10830 [Pseudonocardiaceae bacterium]